MNVEKLIAHWGIPREDIADAAVEVIKKARDDNRPKCGDRGQYDAWTRTMIEVVRA